MASPATPSPASAPSTRAQQADASRARLIAAAAQLFAERGYAATSVAAIGEAAGASRGLVNFHFRSKERLLHAVIEDVVAELEGHMFPASSSAGDPIVALLTLIDAHRDFVTDQPARARLLFRLQAEELDPALGLDAFAKLHARWLERTRPWWEQAQASGALRADLDHNAVATVVIGALRGVALEALLAPGAVDVAAAYAQVRDILQRSLLA